MRKFKVILDKGAYLPIRAHKTDAGFDLFARENGIVPARGSFTIDTGVHMEIPSGMVGFVKSRSGLHIRHGIFATGVIDSGYTGSIRVKLNNLENKDYSFSCGDKIAQLVILPIFTPEIEVVGELKKTERGSKGFGSTGT